MITELKTLADVGKLPTRLQHALRPAHSQTHRHLANIAKADRKTVLQQEVVRAIEEGHISMELGRDILTGNNALGPKGKAALAAIIQGEK